MRQPTSSVPIAGLLVLGTSAVVQAQGAHHYAFPGAPGYTSGPKTGSYTGGVYRPAPDPVVAANTSGLISVGLSPVLQRTLPELLQVTWGF